MSERPIIISAAMVRAILSGKKTQTRRLMKPQPDADFGKIMVGNYCPTVVDRNGEEQPGSETFGAVTEWGEFGWRCPYGRPGDRLWVREAVRFSAGADNVGPQQYGPVFYEADKKWFLNHSCTKGRLRPSIHMPRWASRITLEVTDVRVQRVQEISEEDAIAEGIERIQTGPFGFRDYGWLDDPPMATQAVSSFLTLWDSINFKRAPWDSNPWVWAITFNRVRNE